MLKIERLIFESLQGPGGTQQNDIKWVNNLRPFDKNNDRRPFGERIAKTKLQTGCKLAK